MVHLWTIWIILAHFTGRKWVTCQTANTGIGLQGFLNQFCSSGSQNPGCTSVPNRGSQPITPSRPPTSTSSGCPFNEKSCPQLRNKCIPNNIDCSVIDSGVTCRIPRGYGIETQVLICGDNTDVGIRCGNGGTVPVLTLLLVQCQGSNQVDQKPITSLNVLNGPGDDGGAGVYRCSPSGNWESHYGSPFISQLTLSCRNVGCGRVPQPSRDMPIHRRWSWVRAIYRDGRLHCTATIVSPDAVLTAAHCLTRSAVDNRPDLDIQRYDLELPGPNANNQRILIKPDSIHIHPRYSYNNGNHQYDLAIVFFRHRASFRLPIVCIADQPLRPNRGNSQLVFSLAKEQQQQEGFNFGNSGGPPAPRWNYLKASWDSSCASTGTRVGGGCFDILNVQRSQFCATHPGMSMTRGSSGGPFLAEVGRDIEEVWVLMGVLSSFSNSSSCMRDHSIYGQVAEDTNWIKDCVFDRRCSF